MTAAATGGIAAITGTAGTTVPVTMAIAIRPTDMAMAITDIRIASIVGITIGIAVGATVDALDNTGAASIGVTMGSVGVATRVDIVAVDIVAVGIAAAGTTNRLRMMGEDPACAGFSPFLFRLPRGVGCWIAG